MTGPATHHHNPAAPHVAILGAGLLGRLLAWQLLTRGYRVSLCEADCLDRPRAAAAHTAAAMIAPYSEVVSAEPLIFHLGMTALAAWPRWLDQLGGGVRWHAPGSLVVAHPQDSAELAQFKRDVSYKLGADDRSEWLDGNQLTRREAALAHFEQGLYLPGEAYLDNRALLDRLLTCIRELGGQCRDGQAVSPQDTAGGHFDWVLDCRGMGAKEDTPRLRGVRGEVLWVQTPEVELQHAVRLMHPRYKLYVVPRSHSRFIIGATEIESEDRSPISLQSTLELSSALYTINPAFAEARVIETDTNLRPAFLDNLPRISVKDRHIAINGLYRHGFLLAPVLVEDICHFLESGETGHFWETAQ